MDQIESAHADNIITLKKNNTTQKLRRNNVVLPEQEGVRNVKSIQNPINETYMEKHMNQNTILNWKIVAEEGQDLFDGLIRKFENMFDGEDKVKHFDVGYRWCRLRDAADEIREKYSNQIQRELVQWIKKEFQTNELFKIENWKPYRNPYEIEFMFLGYRKLFQYKHCIFQLILLYDCDMYNCKYCDKEDYGGHFSVVLYSVRDINVHSVLDDNIIPESDWVIKE